MIIEAVLQRFNTPSPLQVGAHAWTLTRMSREAIDLAALNNRLKIAPIQGEFNPEFGEKVVNPLNVCLQVNSAFVSDGVLMGLIEANGPKGVLLQELIDARHPISLIIRGNYEFKQVPSSTKESFEDVEVKAIKDIVAFDLHTLLPPGLVR